MAHWTIFGICIASALMVHCKLTNYQNRETSQNLCDPIQYNGTKLVQCFCINDPRNHEIVRTVDCYLTHNESMISDLSWDSFQSLNTIEKLTLTNQRGVPLKYIPTPIFEYLPDLTKIVVKYGDIKTITSYAFANLSYVQEIVLSDNQIETLQRHAFYHHSQLITINMDTNKLTEINRDVFVDLPILEKLFLTSNKISTIHDRAFIHLVNLKELELEKNSIFSMNSETFSGLRNLRTLDLSGNSLEVIGDNTFLPLINLQTLNLEDNKIEMLDEKAFRGLSNLRVLSLARNKISDLDNVKVFEGLSSLISLNLKSSAIHNLKPEVMQPILRNFYDVSSSFEFEENEFPCDCKLDWFLRLKNITLNSRLKLSIENLQCNPNAVLSEKWKKIEEMDKSSGATFEKDSPAQNTADYEYYDETQLNGKLFYIDIRYLLDCNNDPLIDQRALENPTQQAGKAKTVKAPNDFTMTTSISKQDSTTVKLFPSPMIPHTTSRPKTTEATNKGVLNLSSDENYMTTVKMPEGQLTSSLKLSGESHFPVSSEMVKNADKPKTTFTTSRLATVSAKPTEDLRSDDRINDMASDDRINDMASDDRINDMASDDRINDMASDDRINDMASDDRINDMASDEAARPDAHRRVQIQNNNNKPSSANRNLGTALIIPLIAIIYFRLV